MQNSGPARSVEIQAVAVILFCALVVGAGLTAWTRMRAQGMAYGFDVLLHPTGWNVTSVLLGQERTDPYWWTLAVALANTVFVTLLVIPLATIIGFAIGVARHAGNPLVKLVLGIYVDVFRNVPLILQLVFWYLTFSNLPPARQAIHLLPGVFLANQGLFFPGFHLAGRGLYAILLIFLVLAAWIYAAVLVVRKASTGTSGLVAFLAIVLLGAAAIAFIAFAVDIDPPVLERFSFRGGLVFPVELFTMIFAMTVFSSAYIAEIVRGGLQSVPKGQWDASRALALPQWTSYAFITIPLALRATLPSLGNQYVFIAKSSALGIAIGFSDLFATSVVSITQSGQSIEFIAVMMGVYLVLNYSISTGVNLVNRAIALPVRK